MIACASEMCEALIGGQWNRERQSEESSSTTANPWALASCSTLEADMLGDAGETRRKAVRVAKI